MIQSSIIIIKTVTKSSNTRSKLTQFDKIMLYSFIEHELDQAFRKSNNKVEEDDSEQNSSTKKRSKYEDLVEEVKEALTFREVEEGFEM